MKASKMIDKLQEIIKTDGDIEIYKLDAEFGIVDIDDIEKRNQQWTERKVKKDSIWPKLEYEVIDHSDNFWTV